MQREHRERGAGDVRDVELAVAHPFVDDPAHHSVAPAPQRDDLGAVLLAQRVEFVLHDPGGGVALRVPADEGADGSGEPFGGRAVPVRLGVEHVQRPLVADLADPVEQLFLGLEVDVERGRAHSGPAGDVTGGGRVVPALGEGVHGGDEEPPGRLGSDLAPRRVLAGRLLRRTHRPGPLSVNRTNTIPRT